MAASLPARAADGCAAAKRGSAPAAAAPACSGALGPRRAGPPGRCGRRLPARLQGSRVDVRRAVRPAAGAVPPGGPPGGDFDFSGFGLVVSREYALTLQRDQPLGLVFEPRGDGGIVVAEVVANSQAEASGLVHAGDVLKRTSAVFGTELWQATDFRRTMSAIQQRRGDDIVFVLDRPPRSASAKRVKPAEPPCESVGGGKSGAAWSIGAGSVGLASFSLDSGCIVEADPEPTLAEVSAAADAAAAAAASRAAAESAKTVAAATTPGAAAALAELEETRARSSRVHPRLVLLSVPVPARALALLCAGDNLGGVLALLQPYEYGRGAAVAQAAAAAAGARRVCHPLPDVTRGCVAAALPEAAAAAARLAAWLDPARGVLISATDTLAMAAPTVAAATMHWHWGSTLAEAVAACPGADEGVIDRAALDMLAAMQPAGDAGRDAAGGPAMGGGAGLPAPRLALFRVRFTWRGRAARVALVGDPAGGWDAGGIEMTAVESGSATVSDAASSAPAGSPPEREFRVDLLLPRGRYIFKFLADGTRWLVGAAHASAADARGNINNAVEAGAPGAGHAMATSVEAAAWAAGAHRLALVRGAAAAIAASLDDTSLLSAAQRDAGSGVRSAAAAAEAAAATAAALRKRGTSTSPQVLL